MDTILLLLPANPWSALFEVLLPLKHGVHQQVKLWWTWHLRREVPQIEMPVLDSTDMQGYIGLALTKALLLLFREESSQSCVPHEVSEKRLLLPGKGYMGIVHTCDAQWLYKCLQYLLLRQYRMWQCEGFIPLLQELSTPAAKV